MVTRPGMTGEVEEEAATQQPIRRDSQGRKHHGDAETVAGPSPSPAPAALPSSSSGDLKKKKKKSRKTNSVKDSAASSTSSKLKKKLEEGDSTFQNGSDSQTKDKNSEQDGDVDTGSDLKPKKKTATKEGHEVVQHESNTGKANPQNSQKKHSKASGDSAKKAKRKTRKLKSASAPASKTVLDDSAPVESVGNIDDTAHTTIIDSSTHSQTTIPAQSHRERRREQMIQVEMDDPHPLDVLDELERPGAHRVDIGDTHDDESNTSFLQEPSNDRQDPAAEGVPVTAWAVEPDVAPGNSMDTISDVETQDQPADLPEAVVQKGIVVWIQGHMSLTAILIAMLVAAVVVPLYVLLAQVSSPVSPTVAPTPTPVSPTVTPTPSTLSPTVAPPTPSPVSPTVAPTPSTLSPSVAPPTPSPVSPPTVAPTASLVSPTVAPTPSTLPPTVAPPTPSPVSPPTVAPTSYPTMPATFSRSTQVLQILDMQKGETGEVLDIDNLSVHQLEALTWLADEDELALDFQNVDPTIVVQRFALAAFYYATDGWPACLQFLSQLDHCNWTATEGIECGNRYNNSGMVGVTCDGNGYVTSLDLCK
jgi:hypothetical protein